MDFLGIPARNRCRRKIKKRPETLASPGTPEQPSPEVCSLMKVLAAGIFVNPTPVLRHGTKRLQTRHSAEKSSSILGFLLYSGCRSFLASFVVVYSGLLSDL